MLRRTIALALVLGVAALVPLPSEACAMQSGLAGPCECPMMDCGQMQMEMPMSMATPAPASGSAISCYCVQSSAPSPSAVQDAASPAPTIVAVRYAQPIRPIPPVESAKFRDVLAVSQLGPPGGRLGLHLLLI